MGLGDRLGLVDGSGESVGTKLFDGCISVGTAVTEGKAGLTVGTWLMLGLELGSKETEG